ALRNSPKISRATTQRIRTIADRLHYRPNPLVSALMAQLRYQKDVKHRTKLAYVTAFATADGWRQPGPFVPFFEGARKRAHGLGYDLEEWWARDPETSESQLCEDLITSDIRGLIIAPVPSGTVLNLEWEKFATAAIGYSLGGPAVHRASNNQFDSMTLALEKLEQLGYRRIGLAISEESDQRVKRRWSAGMLSYQHFLPESDRVPMLLATGSFEDEFREWYGKHRPDAVLSLAWQCIKYLRDLGARVPDDVGFAHLARTSEEILWAGLNQRSEFVGAAAVDLIDAQLRRNEFGIPVSPRISLVESVWLDGPSLRRPTGEPALVTTESRG
ncbi:MAG: substrate-binding domain-containing protein, partial [Chthoniobacteraceae bacterium]